MLSWFTPDVMESVLNKANVKRIDIDYESCDMCVLDNGLLVTADFKNHSCSIYDHNLKLIKTAKTIANRKIKPYRLATNNIDAIYMTDFEAHSVVMTDLSLSKVIASFASATGMVEMMEPYGVCFDNGIVYVCDYRNKCLIKLNQQLEFIELIRFDYAPWQIKSTKNIFCIKAANVNTLHFYNKDTFDLIQKFDDGYGRITEIDMFIYQVIKDGTELSVYDSNGDLNRNISLAPLRDYLCISKDWHIAFYYDKIVFGSYFQSNFFVLMINC